MMAVELPREEVALLFGTLTACGFLILGVLEIMWPAARRQSPTRPARSPSPRPAPMAPRPAPTSTRPTTAVADLVAVASQPAPVPTPPAPVASRLAPVAMQPTTTTPRPAPAAHSARPLGAAPPAPTALPPMEVARLLLDRAAAERDLERRVSILNRAVAGLTRSVEAAPEDEALSQMLTSARALLWETWERIAMARLAAAKPWSGEILAAEVTPVLVRSR
jgi:hypothetical protein